MKYRFMASWLWIVAEQDGSPKKVEMWVGKLDLNQMNGCLDQAQGRDFRVIATGGKEVTKLDIAGAHFAARRAVEAMILGHYYIAAFIGLNLNPARG